MPSRDVFEAMARDFAARAAPSASAARWLHQLGLSIDRWGNASRERHARRTSHKSGFGVLEAEDGLVRYRMHGDGPSLVFMADPPITLEHYDELVTELARDHRVIVLEAPGFGFSTVARHADFSFERVVEGVRRLLVALGHAPYVLAFPCVSAYSALAVAHRAPELVSALVLSQAPCWSEILRWKAARDPAGVLSTPLLGQLVLRAARRRRAPAWFALAAGSRERRREFIATADQAFRAGAGFALASAFQGYLVGEPLLPAVDTETLFIWGLRDRSHADTRRDSSLLLAARGRILEAPQLGHFPELEDPVWFANTLRDFLRGVVRRSRSEDAERTA